MIRITCNDILASEQTTTPGDRATLERVARVLATSAWFALRSPRKDRSRAQLALVGALARMLEYEFSEKLLLDVSDGDIRVQLPVRHGYARVARECPLSGQGLETLEENR